MVIICENPYYLRHLRALKTASCVQCDFFLRPYLMPDGLQMQQRIQLNIMLL